MMKFLKYDWIVIVAFCLLVLVHFSTNFLISYYSSAAQQLGIAEDRVQVMEQNLFARWFYLFNDMRAIVQMYILPAFFFGTYYYVRRKYQNNLMLVEAYSLMVLVVTFFNASNDVSILLGVLAR